ncbi:glycine-rich protein DOT1-like [Cryptomeria japonica]|uniref:glycine-rich protein DOT1-like n=1 Tax=Cryptomeria japonica TaxID=3369 RepID=UPI0027DA81A4|nr:glycine-rich protein DOT1-like [Cryptomeria japonica]
MDAQVPDKPNSYATDKEKEIQEAGDSARGWRSGGGTKRRWRFGGAPRRSGRGAGGGRGGWPERSIGGGGGDGPGRALVVGGGGALVMSLHSGTELSGSSNEGRRLVPARASGVDASEGQKVGLARGRGSVQVGAGLAGPVAIRRPDCQICGTL